MVFVIFHRTEDNILSYVWAVDADELHSLSVLSWDVLVCAEVVDQSADDCRRYLLDVCHHAVYRITHEDCDDLVVCLVVVQKSERYGKSSGLRQGRRPSFLP